MDIRHDRDRKRFALHVAGDEAELVYDYLSDDVINLEHTAVPGAARGRGVGEALVRAALEFARAEQLKVVATCPYAKRWLQRHPDEVPGPG